FVQDYATGRYDMLWLASRLLRIPLVAYHTGSRLEGYLGRTVRYWTLPRAERLIASGQREAEMLRTHFHVPPSRIEVILTPIDTSGCHPMDRTEACQAAGLDPARRYLLFVGRLDDRIKRVGAQIRAFAGLAEQYADTDFLIVGEGNDGAALRRLADETA